jgi:CHAD domain-containing protein
VEDFGDGFDALAEGLKKTYARARKARRAAYAKGEAKLFHEWRKRVKYHGYHVRLLRSLWAGPLEARRDELDELSDLLGDDHDLGDLRETVLERPDELGDLGAEPVIQTLLGLVVERQIELRSRARPLGARLFAEKPKRFTGRLRRYWDAWQREVEAGPEAARGPELARN